jgi:hypothetical protein
MRSISGELETGMMRAVATFLESAFSLLNRIKRNIADVFLV